MAIYLYGNLRKEMGEVINCEVNSMTEMVKAAESQRPGFKNYIQKDRKYIIRRGSDFRKAKDVGEEEIEMRFKDTDWHILPMPIGYGGAIKALFGVVLIVVGVIYEQPWMVSMGAGLLIGGVAEMLAPVPKIDDYSDRDDANNRASFLFNGPTNRVAPGGAVPLVYGFNVYVGSIFLSGGLEVGDVVI